MKRMRRMISMILMMILLLAVSNSIYAASLDEFTASFSDVSVDEENGVVSFQYHWNWNEVQRLESSDEIQFTWKSQTTNLKPAAVSVSVDYADVKTGVVSEIKTGEVTTHRWEEALEVSFENIVKTEEEKLAVKGGTVDITLEVTEGSSKDAEVKVNAAYVKGTMLHSNGFSTRTSKDSKVTTEVILNQNGAVEQYEIRSDGWRKSPTVLTLIIIIAIFIVLALVIVKNMGRKGLIAVFVMIFAVVPLTVTGLIWFRDVMYDTNRVGDIPDFENHELYLDPSSESSFVGDMNTEEMLNALHTVKPEDISEIKIVHSGDCDIDIGHLCTISKETNRELFQNIIEDFFGTEKHYEPTEDMTDISDKNYSFYLICYPEPDCDSDIMVLFYHYPGVIQWNGQFFAPEKLIDDKAVEEAIFWSYRNTEN